MQKSVLFGAGYCLIFKLVLYLRRMRSYSKSSLFIKALLVSACIFVGATASFAQTPGITDQQQQIQQQIDQLQKLLDLQQQVQQLQQQTGQLPQGQPEGQMPAAAPQYTPGPVQQSTQYAPQQPQAPRGPVTLRPIDTGRNAVTFTIGGGEKTKASFGDTPRFAIKTNLLYAGATLSPNLSFEAGLGPRTSIEVSAGYNGWTNLWDNGGEGTGPDYDLNNNYKRRLDHIFGKAEFRYWFKERFRSHFVGANVFYADYNVGELGVPLLFEGKQVDYDGNAIGGGFTYGYLWRWSKSWAMEFSLGAGVAIMEYDKSFIEAESDKFTLIDTNPYRKTYFGPTSVGIKLVFTIK